MRLDVAPKQTDELLPTPIVHQTAYWGRLHRRLGFGTEAFDLELAAKRGDLLVVRSQLSEDADCAYVPFGPELSPDADAVGTFLEQLSRELRRLLGPRCAFIRWDLPWTSLYARDAENFSDEGEWLGPPMRRLRELRMNFGTLDHNLWKAPRDLLPPDTVLIDLTPPEEVILARMHQKTRYNIRLAQKRGIVVSHGTLADLTDWYELYLATMTRHRLGPMPIGYFRTMLDERAEGSASPISSRLLLARYEGQLLAGVLLAIAPSRATYMYGASSREHRERMPSYALQWAAIRLAKAQGCSEYDMLGTAPRGNEPHPLAGVHRFKVGFGGSMVHREGCWDFPYDEKMYTAWRGCEEAQLVQRTGG